MPPFLDADLFLEAPDFLAPFLLPDLFTTFFGTEALLGLALAAAVLDLVDFLIPLDFVLLLATLLAPYTFGPTVHG